MWHNVIRVLLVDDNDMVRLSIGIYLETYEDVEVIGEAADGQQAIEKCALLQPDVVFMDLIMPGMDGVTAISHIRQAYPTIQILVLTSTVEHHLIDAALQAGAVGYLPKTASPEVMIDALHTVYEQKNG